MANFTCSSAFALPENPNNSAGSSSGAIDDNFDDACSICLEPFTTHDPATLTSCKHEYHLQCILEWSQRSKECPICWQLFVLKDPASQELLAAIESERNSRSRSISLALPRTSHYLYEDLDVEEDTSQSDDSDFDESIMRHLAAASSRARFVRRRERQRSSGLGPSEVLVFSSSANMPTMQQTYETRPEQCQDRSYVIPEGDSPTSGVQSTVSSDEVFSNAVANRDCPTKPRVLFRQPPNSPRRPNPSEMFSFSESIKSKWSVASARYKDTICKSTRGLKEKLLARNNSVKELSKGVQREMTAGIAGVARMIERLDLSARRAGVSVPVSGSTGGMSYKGKGVEENFSAQAVVKNGIEGTHAINSEAPPFSMTVPGQAEVSQAQNVDAVKHGLAA